MAFAPGTVQTPLSMKLTAAQRNEQQLVNRTAKKEAQYQNYKTKTIAQTAKAAIPKPLSFQQRMAKEAEDERLAKAKAIEDAAITKNQALATAHQARIASQPAAPTIVQPVRPGTAPAPAVPPSVVAPPAAPSVVPAPVTPVASSGFAPVTSAPSSQMPTSMPPVASTTGKPVTPRQY